MREFGRHFETHWLHRAGWLRAVVMGANDGIVSTASLIIGIAASGASTTNVIIAGTAGLVAGAMSMAAGEYVSVSSQADIEKSDLARERRELADDPAHELLELQSIYVKRGLSVELAKQVAAELTKHDALAAHAHDELGISSDYAAHPLQAAFASAISFIVGAILPLIAFSVAKPAYAILFTSCGSLFFLAALGYVGAALGNTAILVAVWRVTFWGALAMAATAAIGRLFGVSL